MTTRRLTNTHIDKLSFPEGGGEVRYTRGHDTGTSSSGAPLVDEAGTAPTTTAVDRPHARWMAMATRMWQREFRDTARRLIVRVRQPNSVATGVSDMGTRIVPAGNDDEPAHPPVLHTVDTHAGSLTEAVVVGSVRCVVCVVSLTIEGF